MTTEISINSIRKQICRMMHYSSSSHIGACLSCVDIIYTLYFKIMDCEKIKTKSPDRDIFILSKGHSSAALYAVLAYKGFFPVEYLNKYYINDGILPGHLDKTVVNGIECSTGSLGHGAGIGLGFALAKTRLGYDGHVYVLMGDGECNEGSVWEAVMLASAVKQKNYTLIIDNNQLQGMGRNVLAQNNLDERFSAFGFNTSVIDGHNENEILDALKNRNGPRAIIANTLKGFGVSFMTDRLEWHYRSPNDEELRTAEEELSK